MISRQLFLGAAAAFILTGSALSQDHKVIAFSGDTIYPEGIEWSAAKDRFIIGSVRHGTIGTVDKDGTYTPFIEDESLPSTFGIQIDEARGRLWVTTGDLGVSVRSTPETTGKLAAVVRFDLKSGKRLGFYDLNTLGGSPRQANDVAVAPNGDVYVTDSFTQVVYRIADDGSLSVFADNPMLKTGEGFGLNGIVYHPNGYLVVGAHNAGALFRVDVADPTKVIKVALPEVFEGMDGIELVSPTEIIASVNAVNNVVVTLTSSDDWATAEVSSKVPAVGTFPSAVTKSPEGVWALVPRIDTLFDPKAEKVSDFAIQQVE